MVFIRCLEWKQVVSKETEFIEILGKLQKVDHPNISAVVKIFSDDQFLYVVTDNSEGVYLKDYVKENTLNQECAVVVIHQILTAIDYLHSKGFSKNNITTSNVKIDPETLDIKIENFDLPYFFEGSDSKFIDYKGHSSTSFNQIKNDLYDIGKILSKIRRTKDVITQDFIKMCMSDDNNNIKKAFSHDFFRFRRYSFENPSGMILVNEMSTIQGSTCSDSSSFSLDDSLTL